jgi:hypothetical protein
MPRACRRPMYASAAAKTTATHPDPIPCGAVAPLSPGARQRYCFARCPLQPQGSAPVGGHLPCTEAWRLSSAEERQPVRTGTGCRLSPQLNRRNGRHGVALRNLTKLPGRGPDAHMNTARTTGFRPELRPDNPARQLGGTPAPFNLGTHPCARQTNAAKPRSTTFVPRGAGAQSTSFQYSLYRNHAGINRIKRKTSTYTPSFSLSSR